VTDSQKVFGTLLLWPDLGFPSNLQFGHEKWSVWIAKKKLSTIDKEKLHAFTFLDQTKTC
jgi:hypothetical protein